MNETALNQQIVKYLNSLPNTYAFKHFSSGRTMGRSKAGISDILGCHRGLWVSFEGKVGKNQTSAAQDSFIENIRGAMGCAYVVRHIDEVIKIMEGLR